MPWLACKPFGDIHSICPQANTPILVIAHDNNLKFSIGYYTDRNNVK